MKKKRSLRNKFTGKKRWVIVGGVVVLLVAGVAVHSAISDKNSSEDSRYRVAKVSQQTSFTLTGSVEPVQKEILDNLSDCVIIFGSNGRLLFYNKAYLTLWNCKEIFLQNEPTIADFIESQKSFFTNYDNWNELKQDIIDHISSFTTKSFDLVRNDKVKIEVVSSTLSDGSIMLTYKKVI